MDDKKNIKPKPPSKAETSLASFLEYGSLNTFQANNAYGDTCLHTTVSDLFKKYRLEFDRKLESVINRVGRPVTVKRFWPNNIEHMKQVLAGLRKARGVE